MRDLLMAVALTLASMATGFGLLEAYVRLTQSDGSNFDIEMWRYARDMKVVSPVAAIGHEHKPGTSGVYMGVPVAISSQGLRDREYALDKPAGAVRILMVGDSLTFGWGAPAHDTTAARLAARLDEGRGERRYEVINAGIGNTNTAMQVAYVEHRLLRFDPDLVLLNYFINDAEPTPTRMRGLLIEHSYAAVYLAGRIDVLRRTYLGRSDWREYYRGLYEDTQPGWLAAKSAIARLAAVCRERGIPLLVVNYPELHELDPYPFSRETGLVRAEADRHGLPFLDLLPAVRGVRPESLWVTPTDAHPNATAAERFAALIHAALRARYPELVR
jgi:lysophospholipase L1-like esterase